MAVNLSPVGGVAAQFFTNSGAVLTGGKLYTYAAGTTTPQATYTTSQGNVPWTNPIVLDAAGRVPSGGEIWITDGLIYKFVLKDANDVLIATYDNITGINSNAVAYTNQQEIVTATAGQTVFNLGISYQPGTNSLSVFVDGVNQYGPGAQYSYVETNSTTVTFNNGLHVGAEVKFTTTQQQGAGAANASQVSYTPAGTGAVTTNVQAKLRQYVSVIDFGADPTGVVNSTVAIQNAINACASNGTLVFPAGTYLVTADPTSPITIYKRMSVDGQQALIKDSGTGTGYVFKIAKTVNTPSSDLDFNGQLETVVFKNLTIQGATIPNGLVDNRTSNSSAIYLAGGTDNVQLQNLTIEGFKNAGLIFGSASVRESYFDNITVRYCGNTSSDIAAIHIGVAGPGADGHNELWFNDLRVIYSLGRDFYVQGGAATAAQATRIVTVSNFQFENDNPVSPYWNTPPATQKVWIEEGGVGAFTFTNGQFTNQYATDITKWGYPSLMVGNSASGYVIDRLVVSNCVFLGNTSGGIGIESQGASVITVSSTRVAISNYNEARSIVVATTSPTAAYGTATAPGTYAFVHIDPSCDFGLSPFYYDNTYSRALGSLKLPESPDPFQEVSFYPGGFASARTSFSAADGGLTYTTIDLRNNQFIPAGASADGLRYSVWLISANGSYTGGSNGIASASCLITVMDGNTIADVTNFGAGSLNSTLQITFRRYNNDPAGTLSSGNGFKFDVGVTNTAGGPIAIGVSAVRFGVY